VDAAEARRILDRLFGYEVSPILWRKVNRGLSAGRVQSPAIRLVVEREQERMAHVSAAYWDLEAVTATQPSFTGTLISVDGVRIATGKDFSDKGIAKDGVVVINEERAQQLTAGLQGITLDVRSVEEKPYRKSPRAPFMTSTLQQEGGNKLRITASEVMRLAQGLYEAGYITYMRTDAVTLGAEALAAVRSEIETTYGKPFLSTEPREYKSKVKNAQEAHEAIRPALPLRSPDQLANELRANELALYRLIWQRTIASQMSDTNGTTLTIKMGGVSAGATPADCAAQGRRRRHHRVHQRHWPQHITASALYRANPCEAPGRRGHRSSIYICIDPGHHHQPWLRVEKGPSARSILDRLRRGAPAERSLHHAHRFQVHRNRRRRTRRNCGRHSRARRLACRVLFWQRQRVARPKATR
jgi:hypothetical protein